MSTDALVIGAGINGLLSALFLARQGLSVSVLDQGPVARESTWAGAGILSPLLPWDYDDRVNALSERGRALWPQLAESLKRESGIDPEYWACGMLAFGDFDCDLARTWCGTHGWTCTPAAGMIRLPPGASALWLPQVAQARNPRVAKALVTACRHAGIQITEHLGATGFKLGQEGVEAVNTAQGPLSADRYIVASGAWSTTLLAENALALDTKPIRGQILLFKAQPGVLPHIVFSGGRYLVPRLDGHILVGSTLEDAGFEKSSTPEARADLLAFAMDTCPALKDAELVRQWSGLRPGSPGNLPTVARHPELGNLYVNSGHFRYGVTMAPASAELLTELMLDRPTTLDAAPYGWPRS